MNDINLFFLLFIFPNAIPGYQGQKEIFNVVYYKKDIQMWKKTISYGINKISVYEVGIYKEA